MQIDDYVIETLMRDLAGHDRQPTAFLVYLWLHAQSKGGRSEVQVSYQQLADSTGISKSAAQAAVAWLIDRELLQARKANATAVPIYEVLCPWRRLERSL
ncbi:MAG TPA: helix-turn-helix domain-containing protein [Terriglobales bacterium]|jgi:hypothetical protein